MTDGYIFSSENLTESFFLLLAHFRGIDYYSDYIQAMVKAIEVSP